MPDKDKKILKWLDKSENPLRKQDYQIRQVNELSTAIEDKKSVSLKYILALLNSSPYYLWLYYRGKRKGEMLELYQKPLSEIPIKKISKPDQEPFINVVGNILTVTKDENYSTNSAKKAKVQDYEYQIDQLVYKLYGLTKEEINIIENFSNNR